MKHLESALKTKNDWWAYLVIIIAAMIVAQFIGGIPLLIIVALKGGIGSIANGVIDFNAIGVNSSLGLALVVLPFIASFFTLMLLVKPLHQRTFIQVINGRSKVRIRRIIYGFIIWGIIITFATFYDYYMNIGNYQVRFDIQKLLTLVLVSFLFLPFQTFFEEIFVRGYLAQGVGALTRNRIAVLIIPSMAFALLHILNPEVEKHGFWLMMSQYFSIGLILAITSVLDDGVELAMGAHAANNIFISIFVTTESSALQTDSLLRNMNDVVSWSDLYTVLLAGTVFIGFFGFKYKWTIKTFVKRIKI
nr:type II CAAX endopeptidase family protein [uncultured Carboxylicivirga sp.]